MAREVEGEREKRDEGERERKRVFHLSVAFIQSDIQRVHVGRTAGCQGSAVVSSVYRLLIRSCVVSSLESNQFDVLHQPSLFQWVDMETLDKRF